MYNGRQVTRRVRDLMNEWGDVLTIRDAYNVDVNRNRLRARAREMRMRSADLQELIGLDNNVF